MNIFVQQTWRVDAQRDSARLEAAAKADAAREAARKAAEAAAPAAKPGKGGGKKGAAKAAPAAAAAAADAGEKEEETPETAPADEDVKAYGPLDEDFGKPYRLLVCNCTSSKMLSERFNFSTYPMFLAYYGGRLVFASTAVAGRGASRDNVQTQLDACLEDAGRGRFLPDDYRFTSSRQVSLMQLNASHRGHGGPAAQQSRSTKQGRNAPVRIGGI